MKLVQACFVPQFIFQVRYPQEQFFLWFIQQASELIVRSLDFPIQIFRPSGWGLEPVVQGFHIIVHCVPPPTTR